MTSKAGEDVEKLDPSHIAGENIKWSSFTGKQFGSFFNKTEYIITGMTQQLYSWPFYPREIKTYVHTNTYTQIFKEGLFITT